jgi:hypothetical protein
MAELEKSFLVHVTMTEIIAKPGMLRPLESPRMSGKVLAGEVHDIEIVIRPFGLSGIFFSSSLYRFAMVMHQLSQEIVGLQSPKE